MSYTQFSNNIIEINNGRDVIAEFDLRQGITLETRIAGSQRIFVIVSSNGRTIKVPVETIGAATNFRTPLENMLRNMERV